MLEKVLEKREHSGTVGDSVNWYSYYGEQYGGSFKKIKKKIVFDVVIPLLGIS